jgi:hypothetical protein
MKAMAVHSSETQTDGYQIRRRLTPEYVLVLFLFIIILKKSRNTKIAEAMPIRPCLLFLLVKANSPPSIGAHSKLSKTELPISTTLASDRRAMSHIFFCRQAPQTS